MPSVRAMRLARGPPGSYKNHPERQVSMPSVRAMRLARPTPADQANPERAGFNALGAGDEAREEGRRARKWPRRSGFNALGAGDEARESSPLRKSRISKIWFQCPRC